MERAQKEVREAENVTPPCCPTERYEGRVRYISDLVDKETRTVKVRGGSAEPRPGARGRDVCARGHRHRQPAARDLPQSGVHCEYGRPFVVVRKGEGKEEYERSR